MTRNLILPIVLIMWTYGGLAAALPLDASATLDAAQVARKEANLTPQSRSQLVQQIEADLKGSDLSEEHRQQLRFYRLYYSTGLPLTVQKPDVESLEGFAKDGIIEAKVAHAAWALSSASNRETREEAVANLRAAYSKGDALAATILGCSHLLGSSPLRRDFILAEDYLRAGVQRGDERAHYPWASCLMHLGRPDEAIRVLSLGAEANDPRCHFKLGEMYWRGENGLDVDIDRAVQHLEKASDSDYWPATLALANAYATGLGVQQDLEAATRLYRSAADGGSRPARYALATARIEGKLGLERDSKRAFEEMLQLADEGYPKAQCYAGRALIEGSLGVVDANRGIRLLEEAGMNGEFQARQYLDLLQGVGRQVEF